MTANPDIGRGKLLFRANKTQHKETWKKFSLELNNLGPPIRIAKEWQRPLKYRTRAIIKKRQCGSAVTILSSSNKRKDLRKNIRINTVISSYLKQKRLHNLNEEGETVDETLNIFQANKIISAD